MSTGTPPEPTFLGMPVALGYAVVAAIVVIVIIPVLAVVLMRRRKGQTPLESPPPESP